MTMRIDCKNYESRTYGSGEVVRMCRLDLAPDAPWRCPADCPAYERRVGDAGWTVGSLAQRPTPDVPESLSDGTAASVLDDAENIINAVGPEILADVQAERRKAAERESQSFLGRLLRRRRK